MQKIFYRALMAIPMGLGSFSVLAHPGHAPEGSISHEWQHAVWFIAALVLVVASTLIVFLRQRAIKQKQDD